MTHNKKPSRQVLAGPKYYILGKEVNPDEYLKFVSTKNIAFHFAQNAEDVILQRLFKGKQEGFYIDVGAFHPRRYSNTYLLHTFFNWRGVNIDASSDAIKLFEKERTQDVNIRLGVGLKKTTLTLHKFDKPACNTMSEQNVERQLVKGSAKVIGTEQVDVWPLGDILKKHLKRGQEIDLLNIDIEGFDIQALMSNDWEKYRPKVILIEDYLVQKGELTKSSIFKFLKDKNYVFFSHAFDTSIYVDKGYQSILNSQKREKAMSPSLGMLSSAPSEILSRASIIATSYITNELSSSSSSFAEENKRLSDELAQLRADYSVLEKKNAQQARSHEMTLRKYEQIVQSRTWRYTKPIRRALALFNKR